MRNPTAGRQSKAEGLCFTSSVSDGIETTLLGTPGLLPGLIEFRGHHTQFMISMRSRGILITAGSAPMVTPEVPHHVSQRGNRRQRTFSCNRITSSTSSSWLTGSVGRRGSSAETGTRLDKLSPDRMLGNRVRHAPQGVGPCSESFRAYRKREELDSRDGRRLIIRLKQHRCYAIASGPLCRRPVMV